MRNFENARIVRLAEAGFLLGFDGEAALTEAQQKAVSDIVGAQVTDALGKFQSDVLTPALKPLSSLSNIEEAIKKLTAPPPPPKTNADDMKDLPPAIVARIQGLEQTAAQSELKITAAEDARKASDERAEKSAKKAAIQGSLTGLNFVNEKAASVAFGILDAEAKKNDTTSEYTGGNNLPLATFAKDFLKKEHAYLLKAEGSGGSGSGPGNQNGGGNSNASKIGMDDIKNGMTPAEIAAVSNEILSVLRGSQAA